MRINLLLLVLVGVTIGCRERTANEPSSPLLSASSEYSSAKLLTNNSKPFHLDMLHELEPFNDRMPVPSLVKPWLLLVYFDHLTCGSCLNQNLELLAELNASLSSEADFVAVVYSRNFEFLRNMVRIGKLTFPILLEDHPGQMGWDPHFQIHLVHVSSKTSVLQYFPDSSRPDAMEYFRQEILKRVPPSALTAN